MRRPMAILVLTGLMGFAVGLAAPSRALPVDQARE